MRKKVDKTYVCFRIEKSLLEQLDAAAESEERTRTSFIMKALKDKLGGK